MDTFEAISSRRAIKKFDPNHKMTSEEVDSLMKLTILSPTSYNQQNWRFVTVTDQSIKEKIGIRRWMAILIGFIGVYLVMNPKIDSFNITTIYTFNF